MKNNSIKLRNVIPLIVPILLALAVAISYFILYQSTDKKHTTPTTIVLPNYTPNATIK